MDKQSDAQTKWLYHYYHCS